MVCGGFSCSKNALAALNVVYILVSFILIGVAAYARAIAIVTSLAIVGGIIACGVFLFLIALIGLVGAVKHHQVLLFFYMIILFLLFLIQFAIACACIAVNRDQQDKLLEQGWKLASITTREETQNVFKCCAFRAEDQNVLPIEPTCQSLSKCDGSKAPCCTGVPNNSTVACPLAPCYDTLAPHIDKALKVTGGIGLFFSFTEIMGVWITVRFRNQKDPRANPSAFL
ncbi:tetraspanin-13-like isoform X1 [Lineus longissimus]|uniref:tetraspanin-13-like isoform X1 n=1 Tax=Lineus longissimus TaxID=88925 RepID=UPI002B4ECE73